MTSTLLLAKSSFSRLAINVPTVATHTPRDRLARTANSGKHL
ncbi:hypothetical protein ACFL59_12695 [Planctomycetota bacterium]